MRPPPVIPAPPFVIPALSFVIPAQAGIHRAASLKRRDGFPPSRE